MDKLKALQQKLVVPKGQYNNFGKYKYRSLEDILEALKKVDTDLVPLSSTEPVEIGGKLFIKATVYLVSNNSFEVGDDGDEEITTELYSTAYAELPESRKGMSADQNTGACISYALKYAWGQLLCLDDSKDADSRAPSDNVDEKSQLINEVIKVISSIPEQKRSAFCEKHQIKSEMLKKLNVDELKEILVLTNKEK